MTTFKSKRLGAPSEFVNEGLARWHQVRSDWTKGGKATYLTSRRKRFASALNGSSGSSSDEDSDEGETRDYSDATIALDIPQLMDCLRHYKKFTTPIPLASMVEVLTIIWEIGRAVQQECRDRSRMPSSA
eukprot:TRINITY_DN5634_c0_g2_i8.p1 TRINITY_DN5634_c0_g2~~TRINITY_DN5634_c0_g2_i8.p1  ORF type:complete len:151 (-),score=21.25 TRINITY_DN5634_c0_g2_i8:11-400(-)